ncbi:MAG: hypothetical protein BWY52_03150 [Chloroflexi bacterium ADurb.Bin325]|nr:MAG: hypothetical protein BWY52_03150 [Chloroflexi bacterium ADurb.Bin325]
MIPQDLLEALRCPHCVTGATRAAGDDPGRVAAVREVWIVCQEPGCDRKYPIVDDIPDMRIETADRWRATPVGRLPVPPPG